jgi:hypothetical protein
MANTVQIKRHSSNTNTAAPGSLASGELALNQAGKKLYVGRHNNSTVEVFHLPTLQDLTYGNGLSGTVSSGTDDNSVSIALDVTDSNVFASTSAKGLASFSSDNFDVTSGVVTIKTGGVAKIADDAVDSEHFAAGSIDTEHIADDQVTAAKIADNIALAGNCSTTGNFTVGGNLVVQGDTTTLNTATLTVEDKEIVIASGAADSAVADGAGIRVDGASATILYDHTGTQWEFNKAIEAQQGFVDTTFDGGTY